MATYRTRPQRDYVQIRNAALRDERLSLKAKGLLGLMLTFPPDWKFRQSHLEKFSTDGRDAIRGAIRELEACGYIQREQTRSESGRLGAADYVVDDNPTVDGFSGDGKTGDGLSGDGKPATTKTEGTKTEVYEDGRDEVARARATPRQDPNDSSEARFERGMRTGKHETYEANRVRGTLTHLAGKKFARKHEEDLVRWADWTDEQIEDLWDASSMRYWPDEAARGANRTHMLEDLLNEDRPPPQRFDESLFQLIGSTGHHDTHGDFEVLMVAHDGKSVVTSVGNLSGDEARSCLAH